MNHHHLNQPIYSTWSSPPRADDHHHEPSSTLIDLCRIVRASGHTLVVVLLLFVAAVVVFVFVAFLLVVSSGCRCCCHSICSIDWSPCFKPCGQQVPRFAAVTDRQPAPCCCELSLERKPGRSWGFIGWLMVENQLVYLRRCPWGSPACRNVVRRRDITSFRLEIREQVSLRYLLRVADGWY